LTPRSRLPQQPRQLRHVGRDPPCFRNAVRNILSRSADCLVCYNVVIATGFKPLFRCFTPSSTTPAASPRWPQSAAPWPDAGRAGLQLNCAHEKRSEGKATRQCVRGFFLRGVGRHHSSFPRDINAGICGIDGACHPSRHRGLFRRGEHHRPDIARPPRLTKGGGKRRAALRQYLESATCGTPLLRH
jgi:hypothetical protein